MSSEVKPVAALFTAAVPANCSADSTDAACKLAHFLPLLYVVAVVLGIALVVVIGIAVHAWRKNKETELGRK